jgi:hypothetical protein
MDPNARRRYAAPVRARSDSGGDPHWQPRKHVPKHAGRPRGAARSAAVLVTAAVVILAGSSVWREWYQRQAATMTLRQAAREGARLDAEGDPNVAAKTRAAATGLRPISVTVITCPHGRAPSADATVTVSYSFKGSSAALTAQGVMPCES